MSNQSIRLTTVVLLLCLTSPASAEEGGGDSDVAVKFPFYEYNIPPDSGTDSGKRMVEFLKGGLTDRSDSDVRWDNGNNQLLGKVFNITFDLGQVESITRLRALAIVPPWYNLAGGAFLVSEDKKKWKTIGSKKGFDSFVTEAKPPRRWEFIPEMEATAGRYVRFDLKPSGFVHLSLNEITISVANQPGVEAAKKTATSPLHGFFRPDVLPPKEWDGYWGEGWRNWKPSVPVEGGPGGFIQLYLHNDQRSALQFRSIRLSDEKGRQLNLPGDIRSEGKFSSPRFGLPKDSPEVARIEALGDPVWFDVHPNPITAGGRAELTIRCRNRPKQLPTVGINESEKYTLSLKHQEAETIRVSSVSFSYDLKRVYLFVERSSDEVRKVKAILWDGDQIDLMRPQQREWERGGVAGFILSFEEPLKLADYHQVTAITADGRFDTVQGKVRDAFFPICMFGPPVNEEIFLRDMARHHFNSIAWYDLSADKAVQFGLRTFSNAPNGSKHLAVYGAYLPDEPDVQDYGCKQLKEWLRLGTYGMTCVEKCREVRSANPAALAMLNINSTFKPVNWMCYAQLGDIAAHDPYYTFNVQIMKDPMIVYASMKVLTDNARPKPSFSLLFACSWGPDDGLPKTNGFSTEFSRFTTTEEIELQNAYALAAGVKGIGYWWYRNQPTVGNNPPFLRAMGRVNVRLRQIMDHVSHGIPTDWAKAETSGKPKQHPIASGPMRVWCRTIWSPPDAVIVFVCHNEYISDKVGFRSEPIKNVPVTVQLPELWEGPVGLYEVSDSGTGEPSILQIRDGQVEFTIPSVKVSNWFVIKRRPHPREMK